MTIDPGVGTIDVGEDFAAHRIGQALGFSALLLDQNLVLLVECRKVGDAVQRVGVPTISDALFEDIQTLRGLGCKLALDDFGSGYSTYHFLNLFRPEYIKIEGAFVRRMLDHESDRKIVQHIHDLAQSFGAQTIAESVENEATRAALQRLGIRHAQGMHLGSPRLSGEH